MTGTDIARIGPDESPPTTRRRLIGAIAAVMVMVLLAVGLFALNGPGDSRTLAVTFEGVFDDAACRYEGPTELTTGEVSIEFTNRSDTPGTDFVDFVLLDEGKTMADVQAYLSGTFFGRPPWVKGVWIADGVAQDDTRTATRTLRPGTYALVCGSNQPYGVFLGTGLTVVP